MSPDPPSLSTPDGSTLLEDQTKFAIIIMMIMKRQFIRRSNMARVTTRAPYNVAARTLETVSQ